DLAHRPQASHRGADGGANDRLLGYRHVDHSRRPEPFEQSCRRLENTARSGDILPEQKYRLVPLHFLSESRRHGLAIRQLRHALPPSDHNCLSTTSSDGSGEAFACSVARSMARRLASSIPRHSASVTPTSSK